MTSTRYTFAAATEEAAGAKAGDLVDIDGKTYMVSSVSVSGPATTLGLIA